MDEAMYANAILKRQLAYVHTGSRRFLSPLTPLHNTSTPTAQLCGLDDHLRPPPVEARCDRGKPVDDPPLPSGTPHREISLHPPDPTAHHGLGINNSPAPPRRGRERLPR